MGQPYEIAYSEEALDFLEGLSAKHRRQVTEKVGRLATDPQPSGCRLVQNVTDDGNPVYRIRSGDYRALYVVRESTVVILDIGHRKDVYR